MPRPQDWRAFSTEPWLCPVCEKPSRTERGSRLHYLSCHADSPRAERNWNICMMHYEGGCSVSEVARFYRISTQAVGRILSNVAQYQFFYELDPALLDRHEVKVIPISRRKRA